MERFAETSLDGYRIELRVTDDVISFGTRWDEIGRKCLHGLTAQRRAVVVSQCFDWFRNFAVLVDLREQKRAWSCFWRAVSVVSDDRRSAFWQFMDGRRIVRTGKASFRWENSK